MAEFEAIKIGNPQFFTSREEFDGHAFTTQLGRLPQGFQNLYLQRNLATAPELMGNFDERAQDIYAGLSPKTVFFPAAQQEKYPDAPAEELQAVSDALNDHGARGLAAARETFNMPNVVWLGLASKDDQVTIMNSGAVNKSLTKTSDELGWFMRSPATDIAMVGPRMDDDERLTVAMGVADCEAIPVIDTRTGAFSFIHAGRPGIGLHTAEKGVELLRYHVGSRPSDMVAFIGEGVCSACYLLDDHAIDDLNENFGATEVDKVVDQYPDALKEVETEQGRRYAFDSYAFNKYQLAVQGVGEIIVAANCTARLNPDCESLLKHQVPAESDQQFFSHMRSKGQKVGWTMQSGEMLDLDTFHLTTPRNLATITRF